MTIDSQVRDALVAVVGERHVLTDPELTAAYEHDITGRWVGLAGAVIRPADTCELAQVVRLCAQAGLPLVPQGGNTGLVGGGIPHTGEVVISLARMTSLKPVDTLNADVIVEAGATLADVQRHAREVGLEFEIDIAARDSATVGGMAATNAGGAMAYRYGTMASRVAGIEMVLADGSVVSRLDGLRKDTAGLRLSELLVGSEGTLAIITRLRLRLGPRPASRIAALCGLPSMTAAMRLFEALQRRVPAVEAVDFYDQASQRLAETRLRASSPLRQRHPINVIIGCAGDGDLVAELADAFEWLPGDIEVVVAEGSSGRQRAWAPREALNEAVSAAGPPLKIDAGLPLDRIAAFSDQVRELVANQWPAAQIVLWGHLGDGNVHVNLLGLDADSIDEVEAAVIGLLVEHGGTFSAEHGVGRAKLKWLPLIRDAAELALLRSVKSAFDPSGLLNPGCSLPAHNDLAAGDPTTSL
jgi:FAD/FMN-containing dehydrogenase